MLRDQSHLGCRAIYHFEPEPGQVLNANEALITYASATNEAPRRPLTVGESSDSYRTELLLLGPGWSVSQSGTPTRAGGSLGMGGIQARR